MTLLQSVLMPALLLPLLSALAPQISLDAWAKPPKTSPPAQITAGTYLKDLEKKKVEARQNRQNSSKKLSELRKSESRTCLQNGKGSTACQAAKARVAEEKNTRDQFHNEELRPNLRYKPGFRCGNER